MLEVQQLVNRSSKRQYTLRADSTIEFKFLTKIKKYLSILNGFLGIVNRYQNRVQQQIEEKSESIVFDSVDYQSVDSMSISNSVMNDNGEPSNITFEGNEDNRYPNIIIDDDTVHSPARSDSINMNVDIDNLWLGIGQFMGPRPTSPPKIEDDEYLHGEEEDHFDDNTSLNTAHSNSTATVISSVKRRLSKLEQFELEQQMAAIGIILILLLSVSPLLLLPISG
jgi:hypothetical protein